MVASRILNSSSRLAGKLYGRPRSALDHNNPYVPTTRAASLSTWGVLERVEMESDWSRFRLEIARGEWLESGETREVWVRQRKEKFREVA